MSTPFDPVANGSPTVRATVTIGMGGTPLRPDLDSRLLRVVVDTDLHLPDMFELTFLDLDGSTMATAGIAIGTRISVAGSPTAGASARSGLTGTAAPLIVGEVTAIEGLMQGMTVQTVVRGYSMEHRLQRARKSRTFLNSTDADIARQVAAGAGLAVGTILPTRTTHAYLPQVNQTDWEFLTARATEIGYEVGVEAGVFYFRPAAGVVGGRGIGGAVRGAVGRAAAGAVRGALGVTVNFPDTLISFRPRITAGNITPNVEVRVWDPMERRAVAQVAATPAGPSPSPASLGGQFTGGGLGAVAGALGSAMSAASSGNISGAVAGVSAAASSASSAVSSMTGGLLGSPIGYLGPPPSPTAHVVSDRPVANGYTMATTGPLAAASLGSDLGSTYAEAEGDAVGNPGIKPGATITVTGVPAPFGGGWKISRARHVFDDSEHGYRTTFAAHGRQDRSMLGLTSKAAAKPAGRSTIDGVVCGVVSNCADPLGKSRVKVTLPWLSPTFETDWAPVAQYCAGQRTGAMFMPEVGDEVLVAFEFGDPRRAYVLGGMVNNYTRWNLSRYPISAGSGLLSGLGSTAGGMAGGAAGGGAMGTMAGSVAGGAAMGAIGASVMSPGMISEVRHRGFVSSTGNCLIFYDHPLPLPLPTGASMGQAASAMTGGGGSGGGMTGDPAADAALKGAVSGGMQGMGSGSGGGMLGGLTSPGFGALGSAVRLGSQDGSIGLTVDQVNAGVSLSCNAILGVSTIPLPTMDIKSENGTMTISSGPAGMMTVDGGTHLEIKSAGVITMTAPLINLNGMAYINGLPII